MNVFTSKRTQKKEENIETKKPRNFLVKRKTLNKILLHRVVYTKTLKVCIRLSPKVLTAGSLKPMGEWEGPQIPKLRLWATKHLTAA